MTAAYSCLDGVSPLPCCRAFDGLNSVNSPGKQKLTEAAASMM